MMRKHTKPLRFSSVLIACGFLILAVWSTTALAQGDESGMPPIPGNPIADLQGQIDELRGKINAQLVRAFRTEVGDLKIYPSDPDVDVMHLDLPAGNYVWIFALQMAPKLDPIGFQPGGYVTCGLDAVRENGSRYELTGAGFAAEIRTTTNAPWTYGFWLTEDLRIVLRCEFGFFEDTEWIGLGRGDWSAIKVDRLYFQFQE